MVKEQIKANRNPAGDKGDDLLAQFSRPEWQKQEAQRARLCGYVERDALCFFLSGEHYGPDITRLWQEYDLARFVHRDGSVDVSTVQSRAGAWIFLFELFRAGRKFGFGSVQGPARRLSLYSYDENSDEFRKDLYQGTLFRLMDVQEFFTKVLEVQLPVLLCPTEEAHLMVSNVRREARKLDTQAMYESWRKEYRALKRRRPGSSDVWCSRQIAKMDIGQGRDSETIRKKMKG